MQTSAWIRHEFRAADPWADCVYFYLLSFHWMNIWQRGYWFYKKHVILLNETFLFWFLNLLVDYISFICIIFYWESLNEMSVVSFVFLWLTCGILLFFDILVFIIKHNVFKWVYLIHLLFDVVQLVFYFLLVLFKYF